MPLSLIPVTSQSRDTDAAERKRRPLGGSGETSSETRSQSCEREYRLHLDPLSEPFARPSAKIQPQLSNQRIAAASIRVRGGTEPSKAAAPQGLAERSGGVAPPLDPDLRREWNCSRSTDRAGELGEDRQVSVQPNPVESTDAQRGKRPLVLEASELALNRSATTV